MSKDRLYNEENIMKKYVLSFCLCCLLIGTHIQAAPQKNVVTTVSAIGVNSQAAPTTVSNRKLNNQKTRVWYTVGRDVINTVLFASSLLLTVFSSGTYIGIMPYSHWYVGNPILLISSITSGLATYKTFVNLKNGDFRSLITALVLSSITIFGWRHVISS